MLKTFSLSIFLSVIATFERTYFFAIKHSLRSQAKQNKTPPAPVAKVSNLPFTVGKYTFTKLIGKGGFAEVYLVTHPNYRQPFCAKVMAVDPSEAEHKWEVFDAEINSLLLLDHPHIVHLYDRFRSGFQFYIILQYCPNGSVHDEIVRTGGLSYDRFIQLATQIIGALAFCHNRNVAHRDIKPGNILLDCCRSATLADFGLSLQTAAGEMHKSVGGSYMYTAPEIFQKKAHDPMAGDVWALGVCFAIMISGASPWQCDNLGGLKQLAATGQIKYQKKVPSDIAHIISQMIVVDPTKRLTIKELVAHPMFNRRSLCPIHPRAGIQMCAWDQIVRDTHNPVDIFATFDDTDDGEEETSKLTDIYSASSLRNDYGAQTLLVRQRLLLNHPVETFVGFADDVREL